MKLYSIVCTHTCALDIAVFGTPKYHEDDRRTYLVSGKDELSAKYNLYCKLIDGGDKDDELKIHSIIDMKIEDGLVIQRV